LAMLAGSCCKRFPASISFCSSGRWPSSSGSCSMQLSVRISQRSKGGSASPGTCSMRLALKPIMLSCAHCPRQAGSSVNWLSEQNRMRKRVRRCRSSGRLLRAFPLRLRISSESASWNISAGNSVSPHDRSRRLRPASWPARSLARVSISRVGTRGQGQKVLRMIAIYRPEAEPLHGLERQRLVMNGISSFNYGRNWTNVSSLLAFNL